MDRIFRIEQNGRPEYVLGNDDGTEWRRLDGDPCGDYTTGPTINTEGARALDVFHLTEDGRKLSEATQERLKADLERTLSAPANR